MSFDNEAGDDATSAVTWQSPQRGANGFIFGTFRDESDVDVYRVAVGAGDRFEASVMNGTENGAGGTSEIQLRITDGGGRELAATPEASFEQATAGPASSTDGSVLLWVSRGPSSGANPMYGIKPVVF